MIKVEQINRTQMLKITVDCNNSHASYKLSEIILRVIPEVIDNYGANATYTVVRSPEEPSEPVFPDTDIFTAGGAIIGIIISIIGIIIIWKLDTTITSDDDLTEGYDIDILGEVPDFDNEVDYLGR